MKEYENKKGELHRFDGPAQVFSDGESHYLINLVEHRENGPCNNWAEDGKTWIINGEIIYSVPANYRVLLWELHRMLLENNSPLNSWRM